nr:unnamed protein product [Digitaria exilis]
MSQPMASSLGTNPPRVFLGDLDCGACHLCDHFIWKQKQESKPSLNALVTVRARTRHVLRDLQVDAIKEQLLNSEPSPSPSPYDTAWVAMVPERRGSPGVPRFPRCVDWIMESQRTDGSWGLKQLGLGDDDPSLAKDALSSTLACVLALRTWGAGDEHVRRGSSSHFTPQPLPGAGTCHSMCGRTVAAGLSCQCNALVAGLRFIGHNSSCLTDDKCDTPVGFNVIFPGMLARGIGMGLDIPLNRADMDAILRLRDMELKSRLNSIMASGSKAFMAYVAEGLGDLLDWDQVMAYQRKNGSFFNSPATTAAAAIHNGYNGRALDYLDSLISKSWLDNDEEIMLDMATCAVAFRLLRMHGYNVSSDGLALFSKESSFHDSVQGYLGDTEALLELYRASQVQILEEEIILQDIGSWSAKLLKEQVEYALKFPWYATLERLEHKRNIEHFKTDHFQLLKSAYCLPPRANEEILALAADGFRSSQAVYQQELQHLESWVKEVRLDELEFARVLPLQVLFSAAATMFPSELSEARLAWSKNSILTTVMDDLFDIVGSREELENLVALVDRWDAYQDVGFCSQRVEILFRAIYDTNTEFAAKAAGVQNRSIIDHVAELWVDTARGMLAEAEWRTSGQAPSSMAEYMVTAEPSFALGPIVPVPLYLVGPELPGNVARCPEYREMLRHMNICGRLLNDLWTYSKERGEGTVNGVLLLADLRYGGSSSAASVEATKRELSRTIEASRRELFRLVVREDGAVPRPCRQLFWNMCKVLHHFYLDKDGYVSPKVMMHAASAVLLQPLQVPPR